MTTRPLALDILYYVATPDFIQHHDDTEETARLRRELEEPREQMKKQGAAR